MKNMLLTAIIAGALGYKAGQKNTTLIIETVPIDQEKEARLIRLYVELKDWMRANVTDNDVSPEEYRRVVTEKIEFIEAIEAS